MSTYLCKYWDLIDTYETISVNLQILILLVLWKHYCPLTNITRLCIRIIHFIYLYYLSSQAISSIVSSSIS